MKRLATEVFVSDVENMPKLELERLHKDVDKEADLSAATKRRIKIMLEIAYCDGYRDGKNDEFKEIYEKYIKKD